MSKYSRLLYIFLEMLMAGLGAVFLSIFNFSPYVTFILIFSLMEILFQFQTRYFERFSEVLLESAKSIIKGLIKNNNSLQKMENEFENPLDFAVYFDAPVKSEYQLLMWMPYLKEISDNYVIIVRTANYKHLFTQLGYKTRLVSLVSDLDVLNDLKPKVVFYVNNGMRNTHAARLNNFLHVQLLHGESDKEASFNPVISLYDKILVAGKIAIDRYYDNNIFIPIDKFLIVSRPQCENLEITNNKSILKHGSTVFYATTWSGLYEDANYSSMAVAYDICKMLIDSGLKVIFRPHPYSYKFKQDIIEINKISKLFRDTNKTSDFKHLISNNKSFDFVYPKIEDCINKSDLMISDVTSVLGDWLYTNKPYVTLSKMENIEEFERINYLARAGLSVPISQYSQISEYITELMKEDYRFDKRTALRKDALGIDVDQDVIQFFHNQVKSLFDIDKKAVAQKKIKDQIM